MENLNFVHEPIKIKNNWMVLYLECREELSSFFILEDDWKKGFKDYELSRKVLNGDIFWKMYCDNLVKVERFEYMDEVGIGFEIGKCIEILKTLYKEGFSETPELKTENWRESVTTRLDMIEKIISNIKENIEDTQELLCHLRIAKKEHEQIAKQLQPNEAEQ